jgi:hypothetical protein
MLRKIVFITAILSVFGMSSLTAEGAVRKNHQSLQGF